MKQKYMDGVRHSAVNSSMEQLNKFGLQMFYTADMENVSYAKDIDCFIVTEQEGYLAFAEYCLRKSSDALRCVAAHGRGIP